MRRRRAPKRPVMPDPIYNSEVVTKFINKVMWDGKKTLAERIVYGAIERLNNKEEGTKGIDIFFKAIENVKQSWWGYISSTYGSKTRKTTNSCN